MGILYCARNKNNGKTYVGKTKLELSERRNVHKYDSKNPLKTSLLGRAIRKHGWDSFEWSEIYSGEDYSDREYEFIKQYGGEYNMAKSECMQDTYFNNPNLIEIRKKLSELHSIKNEEKRSKIEEDVVIDYNSGISTAEIYKKYKLGRFGFLKIAEKYGLDLKLCRNNFLNRIKNEKILNEKPKNIISEKSYKSKLENLGSTSGRNNIKWCGYWITPNGEFDLIKDAMRSLPMSEMALRNLCKKNNLVPLSLSQIRRNKWLRENCVISGSTPKDIGFGFFSIK